MANQARLAANQSRYARGQPGVPRQGQALLQGIAICGRCGARMALHYSGPHSEFPVYVCQEARDRQLGARCQEVRALGVDAAIEQVVFQALAPDRLAVALATLAEVEREDAALQKQWHLRLERARYEAERAQRQYDACEPENRLVARTLERQWEEKLRAIEQLEREFAAWCRRQPLTLTAEDRATIVALAEDLPGIWSAPTTTPADRKQLVRLLITTVLVDQRRRRGLVWLQINWRTGATTEHWLRRNVRGYAEYAEAERLEQRVRELHAAHLMDAAIAEALNAEGWRTAHGPRFTGPLVYVLRKRWGLSTWNPSGPNPPRWPDGTYSVAAAAQVLDVYPGTIWLWLRRGILPGWHLGKGTPWHIDLSEESLHRVQQRLRRTHKPRWSAERRANRLVYTTLPSGNRATTNGAPPRTERLEIVTRRSRVAKGYHWRTDEWE
ncbi:MAG TPA: zinc ribbon domain-containing protein, partial [Chloroflexota bacterium]|nr:zinc ribbon domain-containing protein [Chloroflexota bacterium]